MSVVDYKGWRVPEYITIVAKDVKRWEKGRYVLDGTYQGYVVDPENKDTLKSAHDWACWTEYKGEYNPDTRHYDEEIKHEGKEYTFSNNGFTLELLHSAEGSSQGGKLSFWNCKISKDGHEFIIGIASDYLLEILLHNDFKHGVCQSTLSFARCKGGVGMLNETMPSYQQFLQDEKRRASMKKGKTKKRIPGHLYSTLTGGDVYFGTFYRWYEPVYGPSSRRYPPNKIVGFRKLETPVVQHWQAAYDSDFTKKSEYLERNMYFSNSIPARVDSGPIAELDITNDEAIDYQLKKIFTQDMPEFRHLTWYSDYIGLSTSNTEYELPEWLQNFITEKGYTIYGVL